MIVSTFKKAFNLSLANMVAMALGLLSIPIIIPSLGAETYGNYILTITFCLIISQVVNTRSWEYILSVKNLNNDKVSSAIVLDFAILVILFGLTLFLAPYLGLFFEIQFESIVYLALIASTTQVNWPQGVLRLKNKIFLLSILSVVAPLSKFIWICYADQGDNLDFDSLLEIHALCETFKFVVFNFTASIFIPVKHVFKVSINNFLATLRHCTWLNLGTIMDLPSREFDKVLTSTFFGAEALAIYHIAKKITSVLSIISMPIYQVLYPVINTMYSNKSYTELQSSLKRLMALLMSMTFAVWLLILLFFEVIDNFVFDSILSEHKYFVLSYLLLFSVVTSLSPIHPLFNVVGFYKKNFSITFITNALYFIIFLLIAEKVGLAVVLIAFASQSILLISYKYLLIYQKIARLKKSGDPN